MNSRPRIFLAIVLVFFGLAALLLVSCDLPSSEPAAAPTATSEMAASTPAPEPTPVADATPSAPASSMITLTVWTTETFSPTQVITSGQILAQQVAAFEESHSDVRIQFVLKKPYGDGGLLDFLVATGAVVPGLLPDLVVIDVDELGTAVQAELIQPLDDLVPPALIADLYPFAREACTFDGQLYALQFYADLDHLVYNIGRLSTPPRSWPGVLSNPGPYLFPAGGKSGLVDDAFLIQYLAVRGQPVAGDAQAPFLEADSLAAVFQFYRDGISRGVFPANVADYGTTDDCWRGYLAGEAILSHVSAHRYLLDRQRLSNTGVAPIPAIRGPAAAIGRGWALALVATDPARQSAAVAFVVQLMAAEVGAAWTRAAGYLPAGQAALAEWDEADSYTRFSEQQLQSVQPRPRLSNYAQVAAALQEALEAVLAGTLTAEEAAAQVMERAQ